MTQLEFLIKSFVDIADDIQHNGESEFTNLLNGLRAGRINAYSLAAGQLRIESDIAVSIWTVSDVMSHAAEQNIECNEEQAKEILKDIVKFHDANVGINWDVISEHLNSL